MIRRPAFFNILRRRGRRVGATTRPTRPGAPSRWEAPGTRRVRRVALE